MIDLRRARGLRALFVTVLLCTCGAARAGAPLPLNGGFETIGANGLPSNWKCAPTYFASDREQVHDGKASLRAWKKDAKDHNLAVQFVNLDYDRTYNLSAWVKTKGGTPGTGGARVAVEWTDPQGHYLGGAYSDAILSPDGWTRIDTGDFAVPPGAKEVQVICWVHSTSTGTAWFDDVQLTSKPEAPMRAVLQRPSYRGRLVEGTASIDVACWTRQLPANAAAAAATLKDGHGQVIGTVRKAVRSKEHFELSLPASGIAAGDYWLSVELLDGRDAAIQTVRQPIHIVPKSAPAPTVYIDDHQRLIVRGRPMFPFGVYGRTSELESGLALLKGTSFNFVMPYGWPAAKYFKMAQDAGIYMFASLKDFYHGMGGTQDLIHDQAQETQVVGRYVNMLKDEPALLGWYTVDELSPKFMDRIHAQYDVIRKLDPNHPTWAVYYQLGQLHQYMEACDIIGSDPYPVPGQPLSMVSQWTRTTMNQVGGGRPVWQAIQAYNNKYFSHSDVDRAPTAQEVHNMVWQAIADGANGIVLYEFWIMRNDPDVPFATYWPKIKAIADEVAKWSPVLLSIEPSPKITISASERPAWLSYRVQTCSGRTFVFAVNNTSEKRSIRFSTDAAIDHVSVAGGHGKRIDATNGAWRDTFEPLELRIYELNGKGLALPQAVPVRPPTNTGAEAQ